MDNYTSVKRHPLFQGENTLDFGDEFDVQSLTDEQKADSFMSKYMDVINPIKTYETYFKSSAKSVDHILRDVKLYYRKLVLTNKWSEKKYVKVINQIFEKKLPLTVATLDRGGLIHDRENSTKRSRRSRR